MKKLLYVLTGLCLLASLFTACEKPNATSEENGGSPKENYTETAFGMHLEMVYVEGGTFEMGTTEEQGEVEDFWKRPVQTIRLDGYYIGKYQVTQAQWEAVMGTTLKEQRDKSYSEGKLWGEGAEYPIYYVTWVEAQEFCKRLSEATGKRYVLPTDAQWEYAARGGNKSQHYRYAGSNDINEVAWYYENSAAMGEEHQDFGTHPVGQKQANELGIYDMSGNVWECTSDKFEYEVNDPEISEPYIAHDAIVRGGSFADFAGACKVSLWGYVPDNEYGEYCLGFRVACSAE